MSFSIMIVYVVVVALYSFAAVIEKNILGFD